jgi:hypothetical protein
MEDKLLVQYIQSHVYWKTGLAAERQTYIGLYIRKQEKGKGHVYWKTGITAERQAYIGLHTRKQETRKGQPRECQTLLLFTHINNHRIL